MKPDSHNNSLQSNTSISRLISLPNSRNSGSLGCLASPFRGEESLKKISTFVADIDPFRCFNTQQVSQDVKEKIQHLEQQIREQKERAELFKECGDLSDAAKKVEKNEWPGPESGAAKRRREEYDQLEEHALKVLRACKRLKGTEE